MINDPFDSYESAGISFAGRQDAPSEASSEANWFQAYRNPQVRQFLQEHRFSSAEAAMESFHTLNERVGDGRDYVRLPQDGRMTLDERRAIYRRLGAPEKPDDYQLELPKEHASDQHFQDLRENTRAIFAEHDVPQDLAQALFASVMKRDADYAQKLATELQEENEREVERLKSEYGQDFRSFVSRGNRVVQTLGLDADTLTGLEGSMNVAATMKLLAAIGSRLGEGQVQFGVSMSDQNQDAPAASLTPEQAQLEIDRCLEDDNFMERYYDDTHPGHKQAFERFSGLHLARERLTISADVASLTPEQAQLEIDRRTKDETFMQLVFDETHPGHDRAFQRYLELHAVLPRSSW